MSRSKRPYSHSHKEKLIEAISKIGFWFKIPSSSREKRDYAGTGAAGLSLSRRSAYGGEQIATKAQRHQAMTFMNIHLGVFVSWWSFHPGGLG